MASQVTNHKCPACTGPLHFVGESGRLECDYCGSTYTVEEIEAMYAEKVEDAAQESIEQAEKEAEAAEENTWGDEAEGMRVYSCPSCGAELICDETTAATSCPYCGNPTVIPGQFHGGLKPDYVIPFKLDKDDAVAALKKYYKGKKLLPKTFSEKNHIEEIKGVYVPFWLFDGKASADISYHATRVHNQVQGDYMLIITEHYKVRRAGSVRFSKVPVDASSKMPDAHMDSIEPYDYSEMKEFSTAYLPGFLADKYDVSEADCKGRATERAGNSIETMVNSTAVGYTTCLPEQKNVRVSPEKAKYVLLPVWMLSTRWNGSSYLFAMNGQTGKFIGDLPISKARFLEWFLKISMPITAVLGAILFLA